MSHFNTLVIDIQLVSTNLGHFDPICAIKLNWQQRWPVIDVIVPTKRVVELLENKI